ncbi:MAG TPA: acyl carrier protein [Micromonospora sp.]
MARRGRNSATVPLTEDSLRQWMIEHLANRIRISPDEVATDVTFESYGIDSQVALQMSGALEKLTKHRLSPGLLYEYQTIDELVTYLAKELSLPAGEH